MMRRVAGTLVLLLTLLEGSCSRNSASQNFRIALSSAPTSLDPHYTNESISYIINSNIYDSLVRTNVDLQILPSLASKWTNPDDLTWSFDLVPGVRFQDGTPFTSDDVAFSLLRARNDPRSEWRGDIVAIASVQTPSPQRVIIHTTHPVPLLLKYLACILIVPRHHIEPDGKSLLEQHPVGTGPYRFVSADTGRRTVKLTLWEGYRAGKLPIKNVEFCAIAQDRERVRALLSGFADMITDFPASSVATIRKSQGFQVLQVSGLRELFLSFDMRRTNTPYASPGANPFLDVRVRRAFLQAINGGRMVRQILGNSAEPANQFVAPSVFGYNGDLPHPVYDPQAARALLRDAGYENGFSVQFDVPQGVYAGDSQLAQAVARDLDAIGVRVKVNRLTKEQLFRKITERDTSFYMMSWNCLTADAQEVFSNVLHTPDPARGYGSDNAGQYSNPDVDRLAEQAEQIMIPLQRSMALQRAASIAQQDVPWVPLYVQNYLYAIRSPFQWTPRVDKKILVEDIRIAR